MKHFPLPLPVENQGTLTYIYPSIIQDGKQILLIDTGYPGHSRQIESALNKIHLSISDLTDIVITHHDHDHMGSLAEIKKLNPNLSVHAHGLEIPYIEGKIPSLRWTQANQLQHQLRGEEYERGMAFQAYLQSIESCSVDHCIEHSSFSSNLKVIETPGHCPGHISLFIEDLSLLIAGDSIVYQDHKFQIPYPEFSFDYKSAVKSIQTILDLNPRAICCYHGGLVTSIDRDQIQSLMNV
jgi:glyoxylase-like metal-dependent hydrolase (beta-lactamase superfamily II)